MGDSKDDVILVWRFSPSDYFEEDLQVKDTDYTMTLVAGMVEAHINPERYDTDPVIRETLEEFLHNLFSGAQLTSHRPYELSRPSVCRPNVRGGMDTTLFVEACEVPCLSDSADIIITDKDGNIIADTKRERVAKREELSRLAGLRTIKLTSLLPY
jgi:hypothetical protein